MIRNKRHPLLATTLKISNELYYFIGSFLISFGKTLIDLLKKGPNEVDL